jgi:hypothetical protein
MGRLGQDGCVEGMAVDPVSLVLAAVAAGTASGLSDSVRQAVADAYGRLRGRLVGTLGSGGAALVAAEGDPSPDNTEALRAELERAAVAQDDVTVRLAAAVVEAAQGGDVTVARFANEVHGNVRGFVQGDNNQVKMVFGDDAD